MYGNRNSLDSFEGIFAASKPACPVSGERLDERAVRIAAGIVVALISFYLFLGWPFVPAFLTVDFLLRGVISRRWSPVAIVARVGARLMGTRGKKMIDAAPKIFAARLGIGFSVILFALQLTGFASSAATLGVGGMFALAAFLEVAVAFCLGWRIYRFIQKIRNRTKFLGDGI